MIKPKLRNCKECKVEFVSNETLCKNCKMKKKKDMEKERKKDKPIMSKEELDKLKQSKPKPKSKQFKSQEELDKIKLEKKKAKDKEKKEKKKSQKQLSISNLQVLFQKFIRLTTEDKCASCNKITVPERGHNQSQGGHMIPKGKVKSTALIIPNIYNQCSSCNSPMGGDGRPVDLYRYGVKFWGQDVMDLVVNMSKVSYSFDLGERRELYNYITEKIKEAEKLTKLTNKTELLREVWEWQKKQEWFNNILNQIK